MNRIHKKRIMTLIFLIISFSIATTLILLSLKKNLNVFLTPSQIMEQPLKSDYFFRLGGLVKQKSLQRDKETLISQFIVTDFKKEIKVVYNGTFPDLFREGKGVVASGHLNAEGIFIASQILAKHDENYMPKNVRDSMRKRTV